VEGIVGEPPKGRISAIFSLRIRLGRLKVRRPFGEVLEHGHLVALQPPLQSWTCLPSTGSGAPKGERSSILWCFNSFHEINVAGTVGGKATRSKGFRELWEMRLGRFRQYWNLKITCHTVD